MPTRQSRIPKLKSRVFIYVKASEVIVIVGAARTLFHVDSNRSGCWRDGMDVAVRLDVKCVACVPTPLRPYLESIKAS